MGILEIIGIYLLSGVVAIGLLDLITGRIRHKLKDASFQTQTKLINTGFFVGLKVAMVVISIVLWIFWPVAIYGAVSEKIGEIINGKSK